MTSKKGDIRIGTSGYQYDDWAGRVYPKDLPKRRWLEHYCRRFDTVEINNTFYKLPAEKVFESWRNTAPKGFCFALKFSRYGSHLKHLKDPRDSVGNFTERASVLGDKLGPILVQLPPRWSPDLNRLRQFLERAPHKYRWTFEFRDERWLDDEVFDLLRQHGAGLCVHDMIEAHPRVATAKWVYLRFHGDGYAGRYSPQRLTAEARRIADDADRGLDVYAYFNNDVGAAAVADASNLRRYVQNALD
jgi:uncharacterized protein YecE (DUF72 family)